MNLKQFFQQYKYLLPSVAVTLIFLIFFTLSTCNSCERKTKKTTTTQQYLKGEQKTSLSRGDIQTTFTKQQVHGVATIQPVKQTAVKQSITIQARSIAENHVNQYDSNVVRIRSPDVSKSNFVLVRDLDSAKGKLELKITTYPAADSIRAEYTLAYTETNTLRVDTLVNERVDTVKSITTIEAAAERPQWDRFWVGAVAVLFTALGIVVVVK